MQNSSPIQGWIGQGEEAITAFGIASEKTLTMTDEVVFLLLRICSASSFPWETIACFLYNIMCTGNMNVTDERKDCRTKHAIPVPGGCYDALFLCYLGSHSFLVQ